MNAFVWLWALGAFAHRPELLGGALLAWLFGLRHAADADHLAAIDNSVRKFIQDRQQAHLCGLYFSLGHATVVILAAVVIAATASTSSIDSFKDTGGLIGTAVSALFLLAIALINLRTLVALLRGRGDGPPAGMLARILRPAMRMIGRPAHLYPLGFLFGLGFDTATEVGLLALAATQAAAGLSFLQVLVFPALFTAGMALIDTADSVLMTRAYAWAFVDAARKRTYNITVTVLSIIVALVIGGIEAADLLANKFDLPALAPRLSDMAFTQLGYGIAALFAITWALFALRQQWRKPPKPAGDRA